MSMENLKFILHDYINISQLCQYPRYQDFDKDSFDILLDSNKDFADKELFPVFREMDEQEAHYADGTIKVHPVVGKMMKSSGENGFIGGIFDHEDGGMQLPHVMHVANGHIAECANNHVTGYPGLTTGAANLIASFGSQEVKDMFLPQMIAGQWAGTMCLTEPQAGSSLSDITSSAKKNADGSYKIAGQKIFISGGDHEYCENFVHLFLARIEGAPAGTKGISLFAVPKMRKEADGNLVSNDVVTAADFPKMGQKGYCTTHLVFGENDNCVGWLVGQENKGLKHMFQMMNAARIEVGCTALSMATAAYYASLQYAQERPQGRRIMNSGEKDIAAGQTLIINHPDVRRMLLLQKAITEGGIALTMLAAYYQDLSHAGPEKDRAKYHGILEFLTPIVKTYGSEMGQVSVSNGLQILGGYGFCSEFVLQQYYRDIRITTIYEGTTGIQSLDLLGRKVVMNNGEALKDVTKLMIHAIKDAEKYDDLAPFAQKLKEASKELEQTVMHLVGIAMQGKHEEFIADATLFMEMISTVIIAWQWLSMATKAKEYAITANPTFTNEFYEDKIHTMKFYFTYELPKIKGLKETLLSPELLTIAKENSKVLV